MRPIAIAALLLTGISLILFKINWGYYDAKTDGAKILADSPVPHSAPYVQETKGNSSSNKTSYFKSVSVTGDGSNIIPPSLECFNCIAENETIFFLETNPDATHFTGRKLCAFESAARLNPDNNLVIVIPMENSLSSDTFTNLINWGFSNLFVTSLDFSGLISLHPTIDKYWRALEMGNPTKLDQYVQASDLVRYALLTDHGGFYLDSDTVSMKPLPKQFENYVVEDVASGYINNGIMKFLKGNRFLQQIVKHLNEYKLPKDIERNSFGPDLFGAVFKKHCKKKQRTLMNISSMIKWQCLDFSVLKKNYAHVWKSVDYSSSSNVTFTQFKAGIKDNFIVHYFGGAFDVGRVNLTRSCNLYKLMEDQCPNSMAVLEREVLLD